MTARHGDTAWLSLPGDGLLLEAGRSGFLTLSFTRGALAAGVYSDTITIEGGPAPIEIPVELLVGAAAHAFATDAPVLEFTSWAGGADPPAQGLLVANTGAAALRLNVAAASGTLPEWVKPVGEIAELPAGASTRIGFGTSAAGLEPGTYTALLRLSETSGEASTQLLLRHTVVAAGTAVWSQGSSATVALTAAHLSETVRLVGAPGAARRCGWWARPTGSRPRRPRYRRTRAARSASASRPRRAGWRPGSTRARLRPASRTAPRAAWR